jgi:hypothetical protein
MKIAAAVAALTATAHLTSGCVPFGCGGDDATLDGEWAVTRMFTYESPCPRFTRTEGELLVIIDPTAISIAESDDVVLVSSRRWIEDDGRELVELVVSERWLTAESGAGFVNPELVYQLELVPVTGRLEGTVETSFYFDTETTGTTCVVEGTASAGILQAG